MGEAGRLGRAVSGRVEVSYYDGLAKDVVITRASASSTLFSLKLGSRAMRRGYILF